MSMTCDSELREQQGHATVSACDIRVQRLGQVQALEWNGRLCQRADGSWRQSTYYGEYKREYYHEEPVYLLAWHGDRVVGQLLACFTHPYGWSLNRRNASFISPVCDRLAPWFYCYDGPVVFDDDVYLEVHAVLYGWMLEEAGRRGCIGGSVTPSFYASGYSARRGAIQEEMVACGFARHDKATLVVDLTLDLETLFGNLKKEARNKVRRAQKQAIEIVEIANDEPSLERLARVMGETARRNCVAPVDMRMLRNSSWVRLYDGGLSRGFVSQAEGELLSSQQAVTFNGIMTLGGVSYTDYSREARLYGNDLMQWHIIQWGKENGFRLVDFTGVAPKSASEKMQAIHSFKAKWGGERIEFDQFTIDLPSLRGRVGRLLINHLGTALKGWERRWRW
ncbi:MAG: GNAT family N-acetyltransferase [Gemmatimonadetes bacterium]|jgi:hypothetical protein|nr:GNAT family N-acetyltransferase [Gemmatimonadota bacterium]